MENENLEGMSELQAVTLDGGKTLMYVIRNEDNSDNDNNAVLVNSTTTLVQGTAFIQEYKDGNGQEHAIIHGEPRIIETDEGTIIQQEESVLHPGHQAVIEEVLPGEATVLEQQCYTVLPADGDVNKDIMVPEVFYV